MEEDMSTEAFSGTSISSASRVPRIIDTVGSSENEHEQNDEVTKILSGQYHEENPGQYQEINPGQYKEINPGQYHEVNPGQYHEVNPGQYQEVHPGQPETLDVEVEVEKDGDKSVYNVQSKVDDFIIGEYGTILNGQTLQGVRYTAVDDSSIDQKLILDTLTNFFKL